MGHIDDRLKELGVTLPTPPEPVASYAPFVKSGSLIFISGQISQGPDGLIKGCVGEDIDIAAGQTAARACGLNLIAQVKRACGDLDRVARVVRLGGFVQCGPKFNEHPSVIDGASILMTDVFGEKGRHARAAVGAVSLPLGAAVEIEGVFEIDA